jgi:ribosomal protein L24E
MECDYCGDDLPKTGGKMLVLNSGKRIHFCSGKCQSNWEQNRSHEYADS